MTHISGDETELTPTNFIQDIINEEMKPGGRTHGLQVHTRFPPEPNGYLHIGHAKAIVIDFGLAEANGGLCNLRMDDTNPEKEDEEYVEAIKDDIHWLGYDWGDRFYYASDYFPQMYEYGCELIDKGLAYVDDQTAEEIRHNRGTLTEAGTPSPWRNRSVAENRALFAGMKNGDFPEGSHVLRAKIDMASGNLNMRDPVLYRISFAPHHRTGTDWCIYPMYDFAHPLEDAIECITHSTCSLEFENHRPLYDWVVENCTVPGNPRQIEFARLNIEYTVMSKRKLRRLVEQDLVSGWDDPRMPTLSGMRRRGYTPTAIRRFITDVGVSKVDSVVDYAFLEFCLRDELNHSAQRVMAVVDPVKLTLTNYPDDLHETFTIENNPERPEDGEREISFSKHLWIERDDFREQQEPKFRRLYPGNEARLKQTYIIKCTGFVKDEQGKVIEVLATYDPDSRGGNAPDGRKIKSTLHWVDAATALPAEVRLYDKLFTVPDPDGEDQTYEELINPESRVDMHHAWVEPSLADAVPETSYQFMRLGYFTPDNVDSTPEHLVFNRAVSLKDSKGK